MAYLTIKDNVKVDFEEKKSVFIGHIKRVNSEEEAKAFVNEIKQNYRDARHNVYAYVVGENMGIQRYSDDGEPQGTGGIPMLEVLKKNGITDVCAVVTRYFGGILLGTGGLTRAYSKAVSMAVKEGGIVERVKGRAVKFTFDYEMLGKIQYFCTENLWHIETTDYTDKVCTKLYVENKDVEALSAKVIEICSGKVRLDEEEEKYYYREENRLYDIL